MWTLAEREHQRLSDGHTKVALELITTTAKLKGEEFLKDLIYSRNESIQERYELKLNEAEPELGSQIIRLATLRSDEGYMAEVRLLPDGWLLTENHCPIHSAANNVFIFVRLNSLASK